MTPASDSERARVLIVDDGLAPYVLPAVRALGSAGFAVGLGSATRGRAARSRWVEAVHRVPGPERGLREFVEAVRAAVTEGGYELVFGADDVEMLALSAVRDELPCTVPHAHADAVLRAVDKLELASAADRAGLGSPRTVKATGRAVAETPLPVIVKARLHWSPESAEGVRHLIVADCRSREEVETRVEEIGNAGGEAILQERIDGELMAVSCVVDAEGPLAWAQQRTLRSSLRRTSARAETTRVDPELTGRVASLLGDLGWYGLANLQFLRSVRDGEPKLIDLNGRYYGSIALAIGAGVNLPAIWAEAALGCPRAEPVFADDGVRFQELRTDLQRARHQRRGGLARDIVDTITYAPGAHHSCLSVRDPLPAVDELLGLARGRR